MQQYYSLNGSKSFPKVGKCASVQIRSVLFRHNFIKIDHFLGRAYHISQICNTALVYEINVVICFQLPFIRVAVVARVYYILKRKEPINTLFVVSLLNVMNILFLC